MNGLVGLIFAFWIILIIVFIIAACISSPYFLIGVVVVVIVFIASTVSANKKEKEEENKKSEQEKIKAEKQAMESKRQEEIVNQQHEQALRDKKYLEDNVGKINKLTEKYYQSVYNFVENITDVSHDVFANIDNKFPNNPNDTNILISPYWQSASLLLKTKFKHDGFGFYNYTIVIQNGYDNAAKLQNLTKFFVSGLKKRILDQAEWDDEATLPVAIYLIIRNNVIKYHYKWYIEENDYRNIEDFCRYQNDEQIELYKIYFTYFYIYTTDINRPFVETYHKICSKIDEEKEKQKQEDLENSLFGKPKEPIDDDLSEELRLENLPMSPIEKIDVMTGEEFERYMEKFFFKRGYKVERTPLSGDFGIDLIIEHEFGRIGVQLKCYLDKVPLKAVQEVVAGLRHYGLSSGIVITNSYFQPSAIKLANDNNITLWNRNTLIEKLEAIK